MKILIRQLVLLCLTASLAQAQYGEEISDSLVSEVLKEKRLLKIYLPDEYKAGSDQKYDVVYITDGGGINTSLINTTCEFIYREGFMPKVITVSVLNTDRSRDFLPTKNNNFPSSGGADNFLDFFETELIPHINKNYPTTDQNILFGHSFGGVLAMYALLEKPELFHTFIAVDPSFWWDDKVMQKITVEKLPKLTDSGLALFIGGREGSAYNGMGITGMDSILNKYETDKVAWKSVAYADETHGSVRFKTIYDGLRFSYNGYRSNLVFHPSNGIVTEGKPITILNFSESKKVHYTLDGSEPNENSPIMEQSLELDKAAVLKIKSFARRGLSSKTLSGEFVAKEIMEPMKKISKKYKPGGLQYSLYEGIWDSLPDFKTLNPLETGFTSDTFAIQKLRQKENFGCLFEGYIKIEEEGYFGFGMDSDDGAKLYVADELLIDNDGLHGMGMMKSYIMPLKPGYYPIRIEFFQKGGGAGLSLVYMKQGEQQPKPIPTEIQFSRRK